MTDLVTDQDVEVARKALHRVNDRRDLSYSEWMDALARAALEAFAPLLIERLAAKAETIVNPLLHNNGKLIAEWLRSQGGK